MLKKGATQMITFNQDGETIKMNAQKESALLILSGEPINEKVTQYGPYVMNTQTEIMGAMRDFQQGKIGYLLVERSGLGITFPLFRVHSRSNLLKINQVNPKPSCFWQSLFSEKENELQQMPQSLTQKLEDFNIFEFFIF